jgi:putative nucleotidyltransferase with HDIG domain
MVQRKRDKFTLANNTRKKLWFSRGNTSVPAQKTTVPIVFTFFCRLAYTVKRVLFAKNSQETAMITRDEAYALLTEHNSEPNLINHALESEAVLRSLAAKLGKDQELWAITGLLHDLDYASTSENTERHGLNTVEMLQDKLPEEALNAIKRHAAEMNGAEGPETDFDYAVRCGETVTGLVHAGALVRPTKIEGMKAKSLKKKMKDKSFAASVNRDCIHECDKLGIELGEFLQLAIAAIAGIAPEVGLQAE